MKRHDQEGIALLFVLLIAIVVLGAIGVTVSQTMSAHRFSSITVDRTQLNEVCQAGIDLGIERIWHQYIVGNGNTTGNLASYLVFIDDIVPNNEDLNGNGQQDENEHDFNGDGDFDSNDPVELVSDTDPYELDSGGVIEKLVLARTDDVTGTTLTLTVTGVVGDQTRSGSQTMRISGAPFAGFAFAVLANNINCILCHAEFQSLDVYRNADTELYGSFDRIKVASLESLMIRTSEDIDSHTAGTVYTRGEVYNQAGTQFTSSTLASSTLKSYAFSSDDGKITQDGSTGEMAEVSLDVAGTDSEGLLDQFANLYLNYPEDSDLMTDGELPTSFPAPYPDDDEDRYVDDSEFAQIVNSAGGTITSGVAYGVPDGTTYSGTSLPTASNSALAGLADGSYDGNVILVGTENDPITIDGKVAIDGDLVVSGFVKGKGQLQVRGNVYVVGDVTYADASGEFGVASDGTTNALAVSAGGSILMGDYLTIRAKENEGYRSSSNSASKFIDTRSETNIVTCSDGTTKDIGYFAEGVSDPGWSMTTSTTSTTTVGFGPWKRTITTTSTTGEDMCSFTTSELMLFNAMEHERAAADSSYTPRYYRIRPTQPIYEYTGAGEHTTSYDCTDVSIITDLSSATILDLSPDDYWISEDQLRQIWWDDEMTRPDSGRPFQFDGLLYSNNCIFGLTRSKDRHKSNTYGQMTIRGAIVAADLGMLVPGKDFSTVRDALCLYYDKRVADFLTVEDTTEVVFTRLTYMDEG